MDINSCTTICTWNHHLRLGTDLLEGWGRLLRPSWAQITKPTKMSQNFTPLSFSSVTKMDTWTLPPHCETSPARIFGEREHCEHPPRKSEQHWMGGIEWSGGGRDPSKRGNAGPYRSLLFSSSSSSLSSILPPSQPGTTAEKLDHSSSRPFPQRGLRCPPLVWGHQVLLQPMIPLRH